MPRDDFTPDAELDALFDRYLRLLKDRTLGQGFETVIPARDGAAPRSGTAERVASIPSGAAMEDHSLSRFFRAQSLYPLRISTLPVLAYARLWSLGGGLTRLTHLRYDGRRLAMHSQPGLPATPFSHLYTTLNDASGLAHGPDVRGVFGPGAVAVAGIDLRSRGIRLRFVRSKAETTLYLTLTVRYASTHDPLGHAQRGPVSQGLLHTMLKLVAAAHLRVERISNTIESSDEHVEAGSIHLLVRAATRQGILTCDGIARDVGAAQREWTDQLRRALKETDGWRDMGVSIRPGIVEPDALPITGSCG